MKRAALAAVALTVAVVLGVIGFGTAFATGGGHHNPDPCPSETPSLSRTGDHDPCQPCPEDQPASYGGDHDPCEPTEPTPTEPTEPTPTEPTPTEPTEPPTTEPPEPSEPPEEPNEPQEPPAPQEPPTSVNFEADCTGTYKIILEQHGMKNGHPNWVEVDRVKVRDGDESQCDTFVVQEEGM